MNIQFFYSVWIPYRESLFQNIEFSYYIWIPIGNPYFFRNLEFLYYAVSLHREFLFVSALYRDSIHCMVSLWRIFSFPKMTCTCTVHGFPLIDPYLRMLSIAQEFIISRDFRIPIGGL